VQSNDIKFSVLPSSIKHVLHENEPVRGEVCPELWTYHKLQVDSGRRMRFTVTVHKGEIYYIMSRWNHMPSFAACNANEMLMSGRPIGSIDLCDSGADAETSAGYIGLYGGSSCAVYTVVALPLPDDIACRNTTTGICSPTSAAAPSLYANQGLVWVLAILSAVAVLH
jgi:hypothetical protein